MRIDLYIDSDDLEKMYLFLSDPFSSKPPLCYINERRARMNMGKCNISRIQVSYDQYIRIKDNR